MATRDVGAGGLSAPDTITARDLDPGALTATDLQGGGMGFAALQIPGDLGLQPSGGIDIEAIQRRLRDFGYRIAVDGIWGPKSAAAWTDFTMKGGSMTTAPGTTTPAQPVGGALAPQPASSATNSPAPAPAPAPAVSGNPSERFPEMAALLEVPTIRWLLTRAVNEGWTPERLHAEVRATEWWRTTPPAKRAFIALEAQDPMAAANKIAETKESIRKINQAYDIDMSDEAMGMYARQIASGNSDAMQFQKETIERAKGKYPALAASLDQGQTVMQLFDPYRRMAADELEVADDAINIRDPKWTRALQTFDEAGKARPMTLYEWQRTLRTDTTYNYDKTSKARTQAAQFATKLLETFGRK